MTKKQLEREDRVAIQLHLISPQVIAVSQTFSLVRQQRQLRRHENQQVTHQCLHRRR